MQQKLFNKIKAPAVQTQFTQTWEKYQEIQKEWFWHSLLLSHQLPFNNHCIEHTTRSLLPFFFFLFHQKSKHQLVPPTGWIHMLAESLTSLLSWWHVQLFMQKFHPSAQTGCPGKKVALGGCHWTSSHSTCVHVQQPDWKSSCHLVESWKCHSCTLCLSWGQLLAPKAN